MRELTKSVSKKLSAGRWRKTPASLTYPISVKLKWCAWLAAGIINLVKSSENAVVCRIISCTLEILTEYLKLEQIED